MARQSHPLPPAEPSALPQAWPVLLTRPDQQGARFAADLAARYGGLVRAVSSPLLRLRFVRPDLPAWQWTGLILTSEAGVLAARNLANEVRLPQLAYCVGARTAQAARDAGFEALSADGDAEALIAMIVEADPRGLLLHLHGANTRGDVAARLTAAHVPTHAAIAYIQDAQPFTDEAKALLKRADPVLVPLFSPRTAKLFSAAAASLPATALLYIAALSPAVAAEAPVGAAALRIAARPDVSSLFAVIDDMLQDLPISRRPS